MDAVTDLHTDKANKNDYNKIIIYINFYNPMFKVYNGINIRLKTIH